MTEKSDEGIKYLSKKSTEVLKWNNEYNIKLTVSKW